MNVIVMNQKYHLNGNNIVKHNRVTELTGFVSFWALWRLALSDTAF